MNWEQLAQVLTPTVTGVTVSGIWAFSAQRGRQAFEQRQAADQRIAQQALEALKTELTPTAEVRRQVASRKVEAIFHIAAQTRTLVEQVYDLSSPKDIQTLNKPLSEYWNALRQALLVLGWRRSAISASLRSLRHEAQGVGILLVLDDFAGIDAPRFSTTVSSRLSGAITSFALGAETKAVCRQASPEAGK
jgi:hypothetical protein